MPDTPLFSQEKTKLTYSLDPDSSFYPYVTHSKKNPGIIIEIIQSILERADIEGEKFAYPIKRESELFESGQIDFQWSSPEWFPGKIFPAGSIGTERIVHSRDILIYKPHQKERWQDAKSIHTEVVGTILGYKYHDEDSFHRLDVVGEERLVKMVALGRINVAIINEFAARYFVQKHSFNMVFGPVHSTGSHRLRLQEKHIDILPRLNAAIKSLHSEGIVNMKIKKYMNNLGKQLETDQEFTD